MLFAQNSSQKVKLSMSEAFQRVFAIQKESNVMPSLERFCGRGGRILLRGLWSFKMLLIMLRTLFTRCLLLANMPCAQHIIIDGPTTLALSKWSLREQVLHTSPLTAPEHNSPRCSLIVFKFMFTGIEVPGPHPTSKPMLTALP